MKNKRFIKACAFIVIMNIPGIANAWITPVDMSADLGDGTVKNVYTLSDGTKQDRCDSSYDPLLSEVIPSICHRWGLVFEYSEGRTDWKPKVVNGGDSDKYRLPTIKELVRLFDYTGDYSAAGAGTGLDDVIESWFTITDETWLISSSYRDIDGLYDNGATHEYLQIFALNASTGEVKTFQRNDFNLCVELSDTGACSITEGGKTVHSLKVNRSRLKDMCLDASMDFTQDKCTARP